MPWYNKSVMENNKTLGWAVINSEGDLFRFDTEEEAAALGVPIRIVEVVEIIRYAAPQRTGA